MFLDRSLDGIERDGTTTTSRDIKSEAEIAGRRSVTNFYRRGATNNVARLQQAGDNDETFAPAAMLPEFSNLIPPMQKREWKRVYES